MNRAAVILDVHWRAMDELFAAPDLARLHDAFEVIWGEDDRMPADLFDQSIGRAFAHVTTTPQIDGALLARAPALRAVVEVSGAFPDTIDYAACEARNVEVLSCAPGFRQSVAEMAVAMALSAGRGLVAEHELFRRGEEFWLDDRAGRDFTMYGQRIGFLGFGSIARETHRLLEPFAPDVLIHDPWLPETVAGEAGARLVSLDTLFSEARCLFVCAAPTRENAGLVDARLLARMQPGSLVIVLSRAHLVNFSDLVAALEAGHIRAAIDVFPSEPVPQDDPLRRLPGVILSPHRAAAVAGGRQLIGRMLVDDLLAMLSGQAPSRLQRARGARIDQLAGASDATDVSNMAVARDTGS